jgi:hypothetical protein
MNDMKLWILRPVKTLNSPWDPLCAWCDKCFGMVIRAKSEELARSLASRRSGDEGPEPWQNPIQSSCEILDREGPEVVLMLDVAST